MDKARKNEGRYPISCPALCTLANGCDLHTYLWMCHVSIDLYTHATHIHTHMHTHNINTHSQTDMHTTQDIRTHNHSVPFTDTLKSLLISTNIMNNGRFFHSTLPTCFPVLTTRAATGTFLGSSDAGLQHHWAGNSWGSLHGGVSVRDRSSQLLWWNLNQNNLMLIGMP